MAIKNKQILNVDLSKTTNVDYSASKKTALNLTGVTSLEGIDVTTDGTNLYFKKGGITIATISKFTGLKYSKFDTESQYTTDLISSMVEYTGTYKINKKKVSGTNYNDAIDYQTYEPESLEDITNKKGLTLNAGKGNDTITGSKYNDKISGGVGTNVINLSTTTKFGDDEVVLTKGENLIFRLDVNDADCTDEYEGYFTSKVEGNDLKITVYNAKGYTGNDHNGTVMGTVTVKNYTQKDVITYSGSIMLMDSDLTEGTAYNLRDFTFKTVYMDDAHYNKQSYTGSWVSDKVYAENYIARDKKGNEITTNTDTAKGVTIKLGGSPYANYADGSKYADTIIGGDNDDCIAGGKGNDKITGGKGSNWIDHLWGDGHDIVTLTKSEEFTLCMYNNAGNFQSIDNIRFEYTNKNKDLIIYSLDDSGNISGSVTLKDFGKKDVTNNSTKKSSDTSSVQLYTIVNGHNVYLDLRTCSYEYGGNTYYLNLYNTKTSKNFTGTWLNDEIDASDAKLTKTIGKGKNKQTVDKIESDKGLTLKGGGGHDTVYGSNYSDNINGGAGNDYLMGGKGNDTIKGGDGDDTIIGGKGDDKLYGEKGDNRFVFNTNDGADTIYGGKGTDTIFFADLSDQALLSFEQVKNAKGKLTNDLKIYYTLDKKSYIVVKDYFKKSKGKYTTSIKNILLKGSSTPISITDAIIASADSEAFKNVIYNKADATSDLLINNGTAGINTNTIKYIATGSGNDTISLNETSYSLQVSADEGNNDVYIMNNKNNQIFSGAGNDSITAGSGNDTIKAGEGNNTITAGNGNNIIETGDGNDSITAGDDNDYIKAGNGNNIISTEDGNDTIEAGNGSNVITTGEGKKIITVGNSTAEDNTGSSITLGGYNRESQITTGTGNDTITLQGSSSNVVIESEGGNNAIDYLKDYSVNPYSTYAEITTGDGDDTLNMGTLCNNDIDLGNGNNTLNLKGHTNTITTGSGNDKINITGSWANNNTISAGEGNNTISAAGNYNEIETGAGNDSITLTGSVNNINAGAGNNIISTGNGTNTITTGDGDDIITLTGNGSNNIINLGNGKNSITGGETDSSEITTGSGDDTINLGYASNTTINGGAGANTISTGGGYNEITTTGDKKQIITVGDSSHSISDNSKITTGSGDDEINVWSYSYNVEITTTGGNNNINYGLGMSGSGGTSNTNITTGAGDDTITIGNIDEEGISYGTVGGVNISAGAGANTIAMADNSYNNTVTTEGNKAQTITIGDYSYQNKITTGAGNDIITIAENTYSHNNTITGGEGNNTIVIGSLEGSNETYGNTIETGAGDDIISMGNCSTWSTANTINAGDGHNVITTGTGRFDITTGNSTVTDSSADNYNIGSNITIGNGDNGAKNSNITTGSGNDTITILGDSYSTTINAGDGKNRIDFDVDGDYYWSYMDITTGSGDDTINVGDYSYGKVNAGEGKNTINIKGSYNDIFAGSGDNTIVASGTNNEINTGSGKDIITIGSPESSGWNYTVVNIGHDTIAAEYDEETGDLISPEQGTLEGGVENVVTADSALQTEINIYNTQTDDNKYNTINLINNSSYTKINVTDGHTKIDLGTGYDNTIKTGSGDDTITSVLGDTIDAGDGSNSITMREVQSSKNTHITTGSGKDTITLYDKATVSTGAGDDVINVNVVSAENYEGTPESRGNYETNIAMGAGNDVVTYAEDYKGSAYITFRKGDGANNLVEGLSENIRSLYFTIDPECDFYIRPNETTRTTMEIILMQNGVATGDIMTVENMFKDQEILEPVFTNIYFNDITIGYYGSDWDEESHSWINVWEFNIPTSDDFIINYRTDAGLIEGTDGNDVIYGSDFDDIIKPGEGQDVIRSGKGNDIIDLDEAYDNKAIHYNTGEGNLTITNISSNVYLYMEDCAAEGTLIEKHGNDLHIVRSNGETAILKDVYGDQGQTVASVYIYDKDGTEYGWLSSYPNNAEKFLDVYEDESGFITTAQNTNCNIHVTDSTIKITHTNKYYQTVIYDQTDPADKHVQIDFSLNTTSDKYAKWTRDGDDLVILTAKNEGYENEESLFADWNTNKTRIVDFFKEYNSVNTFIFGSGYVYYDDIICEDMTLPVNSTTDEGETIVTPVNNEWWLNSYTYNAGAGDDTIYASGTCDIAYGNEGDDIFYAGSQDGEIVGHSGLFAGGDGENIYNVYSQPYGEHTIVTTSGQDELHILETTDTGYDITDTDCVQVNADGNDVVISSKYSILGNHSFRIKDALTREIDLAITDDSGHSTTLKDVMLANDIQVSSDATIIGTTNSDYLVGMGLEEGSQSIYGGLGSDTITAYGDATVYTNGSNSKDVTVNTVDTVTLYGLNNTVYAQAETNIITSRNNDYEWDDELNKNVELNSDHYYAYLNQNTTIYDWGGVDSLTLVNSNATTDGEYKPGGLLNTFILCDVGTSYSLENNDYSFDVYIMNQSNLTQWARQQAGIEGAEYKCITIKSNEIETITTADGYTITSEDIKSYANDIAAWLRDNDCYSLADYLNKDENYTYTDLETLVTNMQDNYVASYWTNA